MRVALHADPVLRWIYPVPLSDLVDAVALRIDMQNQSNDRNRSKHWGILTAQSPLLRLTALVLHFSQQSPFVRFQRYNS